MRQTTFGSLTVVALTILASTSTAQLKDKNAAVAAAIRSAGFDCKRVYGVAPLNGSPYGEGLSVGCDSTVPGIRYVFRTSLSG